MVEYVCAGIILNAQAKKSTLFFRMRDGVPDEEDRMAFSPRGKTDVPVGWILNIKHRKGGAYYGFDRVRDHDDYEFIKKYEMDTIVNTKHHDLEKLRKKKKKIREMIEGKTVGELKEWAKNSPTNKKYLKYYLWELF